LAEQGRIKKLILNDGTCIEGDSYQEIVAYDEKGQTEPVKWFKVIESYYGTEFSKCHILVAKRVRQRINGVYVRQIIYI